MRVFIFISLIETMGGCHSLPTMRNVEKMSDKKREKVLETIANEAVLKYCPQFLSKATPIIVRDTLRNGPFSGVPTFIVKYPFDREDNRYSFTSNNSTTGEMEMNEKFSARVQITPKTGQIVSVFDGDGFMYGDTAIWNPYFRAHK